MRVLVVDDDRLVCASLKTILEAEGDIEVVAMGYDGSEAVALYSQKQPDILLMDIRMEKMTGLQAGEEILRVEPHAKILYLTTFLDDEYIVRAISLGAKGYILKQKFESIVPALRAVQMGQNVFGDEIVTKLPELMAQGGQKEFSQYGLSAREEELMALVAKGLSNREIAARLYLSEGTVRNYLSAILDKLQLRDRTQLAIFYYESGRLHRRTDSGSV